MIKIDGKYFNADSIQRILPDDDGPGSEPWSTSATLRLRTARHNRAGP